MDGVASEELSGPIPTVFYPNIPYDGKSQEVLTSIPDGAPSWDDMREKVNAIHGAKCKRVIVRMTEKTFVMYLAKFGPPPDDMIVVTSKSPMREML